MNALFTVSAGMKLPELLTQEVRLFFTMTPIIYPFLKTVIDNDAHVVVNTKICALTSILT